jgi:hypothetical protein
MRKIVVSLTSTSLLIHKNIGSMQRAGWRSQPITTSTPGRNS